jgi:hypothetical protein
VVAGPMWFHSAVGQCPQLLITDPHFFELTERDDDVMWSQDGRFMPVARPSHLESSQNDSARKTMSLKLLRPWWYKSSPMHEGPESVLVASFQFQLEPTKVAMVPDD